MRVQLSHKANAEEENRSSISDDSYITSVNYVTDSLQSVWEATSQDVSERRPIILLSHGALLACWITRLADSASSV